MSTLPVLENQDRGMEGYAKIAKFMGKHPESAQVLRFSDLNLQNILYLQAEIFGLREDLRRRESRNQAASSEALKSASFDWYTLSTLPDHDDPLESQWDQFLRLRQLLKQYNEAILQFHQVSQLPSPRQPDLHAFKEWLERPSLGDVRLLGRDRHVWAKGVDLVSIADGSRSYPLKDWIADSLMPFFHRTIGQHLIKNSQPAEFANVIEYSETGITKIANLIGVIAASLLPVVAIIVLDIVRGTKIRLGLVAVFTAIFSTCLWFLSRGDLLQIFSATSAFAAVQVVFIGTNGCNCS